MLFFLNFKVKRQKNIIFLVSNCQFDIKKLNNKGESCRLKPSI